MSVNVEAYAKIFGIDRMEYLVYDLPCVLGRAPIDEKCCIVLNHSTNISRKHAVLQYAKNTWSMTCLGKDGMIVDSRHYKRNEIADIHEGSVFVFGTHCFAIRLPVVKIKDLPTKKESNINNKRMFEEIDTMESMNDDDPDPFEDDETRGKGYFTSSSQRNYHHLPMHQAYQNKETYQTMIDAAFSSGDLEVEDDGSAFQPNIVDWIGNRYFKTLDEAQKQSLRKGVYSMLAKHYERVGGDESRKRQKRGSIRWRPKYR